MARRCPAIMSAAAPEASTSRAFWRCSARPRSRVDGDGILTASTVTDPSGRPRQWREVGPIWQEVNGADKLQAVLDGNGHIKMFSITPYAPIIEFLPAPASLNAGWILPAGSIALLVLLIAAIGWPVVALIRRSYKYQPDLAGRRLQLHRATRATAWLYLVFAIGWVLVLNAVNNDLTALNGGLDVWMRLLQLVLIVAIVGTICDLERGFGRDGSGPASAWRHSGRSSSPLLRPSWPGCASTPGC